MIGKEKELFTAVKDESGDLAIHFPHSKIAISPSEEFWEAAIDEIEPYLENAEDGDIADQEGQKVFKEVRDIIQDCLENW